MIEIKKKSRDFSKVDIYAMTLSDDITPLKDIEDGAKIDVVGFMHFTDVKNESGECTDLLAIMDKEGNPFVTQSRTFISSIEDICAVMESDEFPIIKTSGTTKAGRPYINCTLDRKKLK